MGLLNYKTGAVTVTRPLSVMAARQLLAKAQKVLSCRPKAFKTMRNIKSVRCVYLWDFYYCLHVFSGGRYLELLSIIQWPSNYVYYGIFYSTDSQTITWHKTRLCPEHHYLGRNGQ